MAVWDPPVHGEVGWIPQRGELMGERERNGEGQGKSAQISLEIPCCITNAAPRNSKTNAMDQIRKPVNDQTL